MRYRPALVTAAAAAVVGTVVARRARRPQAWIGLHLEDGMLIVLGPDDPAMPALRAAAGDVLRALSRFAPSGNGG